MSCAAVVTYEIDPRVQSDLHIRRAREELGLRLAGFVGCPFGGEFDRNADYVGRPYFIPSDTLLADAAARLGIESDRDLFGGVVPHPFVATKAITHPLIEPSAAAPPGWSHALGHRISGVTLDGASAFSQEDARRAGLDLLASGPVRTKPARASAGRDQTVVSDRTELDAVLDATDPAEIAAHGLVIEQNLTDVETYSVGQVRVAGAVATYFGVQRSTTDNGGEPVYGGSDLIVVRGGFGELLDLALPDEARAAVAQARAYDAAAFDAFPGLFASRRNYDAVSGLDARGRRRSGVLEQSWRMGGASAAELAALDAFRADSAIQAVRASTFESYGGVEPPLGAAIYFYGVDDRIGPITRYATVEPYDAR